MIPEFTDNMPDESPMDLTRSVSFPTGVDPYPPNTSTASGVMSS